MLSINFLQLYKYCDTSCALENHKNIVTWVQPVDRWWLTQPIREDQRGGLEPCRWGVDPLHVVQTLVVVDDGLRIHG